MYVHSFKIIFPKGYNDIWNVLERCIQGEEQVGTAIKMYIR